MIDGNDYADKAACGATIARKFVAPVLQALGRTSKMDPTNSNALHWVAYMDLADDYPLREKLGPENDENDENSPAYQDFTMYLQKDGARFVTLKLLEEYLEDPVEAVSQVAGVFSKRLANTKRMLKQGKEGVLTAEIGRVAGVPARPVGMLLEAAPRSAEDLPVLAGAGVDCGKMLTLGFQRCRCRRCEEGEGEGKKEEQVLLQENYQMGRRIDGGGFSGRFS